MFLLEWLEIKRSSRLTPQKNNNESEVTSQFKILFEFCIHIVIGSLLFIIIAAFAIGIGMLMDFTFTKIKVDEYVVISLKGLKYLILLADVALYVVFLISSVKSFGGRLWKH